MITPNYFFYCSGNLALILDREKHFRFFKAAGLLCGTRGPLDVTLLAVDPKQTPQMAYSRSKMTVPSLGPFGFGIADESQPVGYNGEHLDLKIGGYLLGAGRRCYSTSLMRFISYDMLSPFGKGGINGFAYCSNDPVNYLDPTGCIRGIIKRIESFFISPARDTAEPPARDTAGPPAYSPAAPDAIVYGPNQRRPPNYFGYGDPPPDYSPRGNPSVTENVPSYLMVPARGEAVLEFRDDVVIQVKSLTEYHKARDDARNISLSLSAQSRAVSTLKRNVKSTLPMQTDNGIMDAVRTAHQLYDINGSHHVQSQTHSPNVSLIRRS